MIDAPSGAQPKQSVRQILGLICAVALFGLYLGCMGARFLP